MKDTELKVVSELMKNSRRSDRELAKALGISQPTITRTRTKLEKEGFIKEYTLIPDFKKLGYQIMAIVFLRLSHPLSQKEREDMFRDSLHLRESDLLSSFLVMDGIGMNEDIVIVSFFRNFSDYASYIQSTRTEITGKLKPFLHPEGITSFLVNLDGGDVHYLPMTFTRMATHIQKTMVQDPSKKT